jgi:hypothetical protein
MTTRVNLANVPSDTSHGDRSHPKGVNRSTPNSVNRSTNSFARSPFGNATPIHIPIALSRGT